MIETILLAIPLIIGGATLIFRGALIVTKLTKTDRDDKYVSKILKVLEFISLNVGKITSTIVVQTKRGK